MLEAKEKLFEEFPPVSAQEWKDKILSDLKGAPFEKKMVWKTGEGFDVNPFYTIEDMEGIEAMDTLPGQFPYLRGTKTDNLWLIRQDIVVSDCKAANEKAMYLINHCGITSLGFQLKGDMLNAENISLLLDSICPETTELNFKTCIRKSVELIELLTDYFKTIHVDLTQCHGSIAYNPLKKPLIKGIALNDGWVDEAVAVMNASEALPKYRVLAVEAASLNDAGASVSQEAGYALAWGNDLISNLSDVGIPAGKVAQKIKFNFGITSNYFLEIAKFRAVRRLWAETVKAYQPDGCSEDDWDACKMQVYARSSGWNMTVYDMYVNLLRTQTEAMSAALAGVDSIAVLPFDYALQTADDFSERIARNQQLLLKEECHFDQITDPTAGSYYIETLSSSCARAAWGIFLEVEERGGFVAMANSGDIQRAVNEHNKSRKKKLATRSQILVGANQYPDVTEKAIDKTTTSGDSCGCTGGFVTKLDFSRGASEFEALRLSTENNAKIPKVFILPIGNLSMCIARAQFSSNFFACAGYEIIDNLSFETIEAGIQAALKRNSDIIVLCSSDEEYETIAPLAHQSIEAKALLVIAGAPACLDKLQSIGITHFIHLKSNVLESLQSINSHFERG